MPTLHTLRSLHFWRFRALCLLLLATTACVLEPFSLSGLPCTPEQTCPNNELCVQGTCLSQDPRSLPEEGSPCLPNFGCKSPSQCAPPPNAAERNEYICRLTCDPLKQGCLENQVCLFVDLPIARPQGGLCYPTPKGSRQDNEPCDNAQNLCKAPLLCLTDGKESRCRSLCNTQEKENCPPSTICLPIKNALSPLGACQPNNCFTQPESCPTQQGKICHQAICYQSCQNDQGCPSDALCDTTTISATQGICREKECGVPGKTCPIEKTCKNFLCLEPTPAPTSCQASQGCPEAGQACLAWLRGGQAFCYRSCQRGQANPCPNNDFLCAPLTTKDAYCVPRVGGQPTGKTCGPQVPCEIDHACIATPAGSLCVPRCKEDAECKKTPEEPFLCERPNPSELGYCKSSRGKNIGEPCGQLVGQCVQPEAVCTPNTNKDGATCRRKCSTPIDCALGGTCTTVQEIGQQVCLP